MKLTAESNSNRVQTVQAVRMSGTRRWARLRKDKWTYLLLTPGLLYFLIFKYVPMWGILLAFQNYQPFLGFWKSDWIGLENFRVFFDNPEFWMLLRNTLVLSLYNLIFFFPTPIILALL